MKKQSSTAKVGHSGGAVLNRDAIQPPFSLRARRRVKANLAHIPQPLHELPGLATGIQVLACDPQLISGQELETSTPPPFASIRVVRGSYTWSIPLRMFLPGVLVAK